MPKSRVIKLSKREQAVFDYAKEKLDREGELEFDRYCNVSDGDDNGAYVQAWVWVPFAGTALCKGEDGDHSECEDGCPVFDAAVITATA